MVINIETFSRRTLILCTLLSMLAGLFFSRALLSIAMIFFIAATTFHPRIGKQIKSCFKNPWLAALTILFFIPFISVLWSTDKNLWAAAVQIKLPLLFFPIAFAGSWQLTQRQWKIIFGFFLLLICGGCAWSLLQYFENTQAINESYLKAKSIATPFENDHVRFSWLVAVAGAVTILLIEKMRHDLRRIILIAVAIFLIVYLHILSARTGLLCLYFFILLFVVRLSALASTVVHPEASGLGAKKVKAVGLFISNKKKWLLPIVIACVALPVLAWLLLPTFQNRVSYMLYDFSFIKNQTYQPGSNDGARMFSIKAGWHIVTQQPILGAGAGDVKTETNNWYVANVPGMLATDKLYPSSEWLMFGAVAGWVGIFLFTVIMLLPLVLKTMRRHFLLVAVNSMAALSFLFDIGLEVQFGVFVYIFVVLCCYKWLLFQKDFEPTK